MNKAVIEKLNIVLEAIERRVFKRDLFVRRHTEPTQDGRLCRGEVIAMVDELIAHHNLRWEGRWSMINHRQAADTLQSIRDHLDRCYEIRSCD